MSTFERPLQVGKRDNYTLTLAAGYLDGEVIGSATATTISSLLTIETVSNDGATISVLCTGVAQGYANIEFSWETATRSGCETHTIAIEDC